MSKDRERAEKLIEQMGKCTPNTKPSSGRVEWDGSYVIPGALLNDIRDLLATLPEEKEEKQTEAERRDAEYKPCCFVCKYFGSKSHHDLMWCRDCQKYDHFE